MTSSAETAAPARWQSVGPLDVEALAKARMQTINLVQWLARIANSYVAAGGAEERVLLAFRPADAAFFTKPFAGNLSLELRLPTLEMQFHESGKAVPHIFNPEERSPAEAEAWLLVELLHRGVDRAKFSKKLPYNVPGLMSGDAEDYSPQSCQPALMQLQAWLANAATVLDATARASGADTVDIVCWPQTLTLSAMSNGGSRRADYGFTPGDAQVPEPYFYRNRSAAKEKAPSKAKLTAPKLLAENDPAAAAVAFMTSTSG